MRIIVRLFMWRSNKVPLFFLAWLSFAAHAVDTDGDGFDDLVDKFPNDPTEWYDTDNDGIGNNADPDDDNDGLSDIADNDDDNDIPLGGEPDSTDDFPEDPTEWLDTDGDGLGNNADTDDDNDGFTDVTDAFSLNPAEWEDTDGDGIGNNGDVDRDGDGFINIVDDFPDDPSEWLDTDGNGVGNNTQLDDDNDGVLDVDDDMPLDSTEYLDTDNDNIGNNADDDDDGDGVQDNLDACPLDPNERLDTDNDVVLDSEGYVVGGACDNGDNDIDGDGVLNTDDDFPFDSTETNDLDNDNIGDNTDPDIDGDGVVNSNDVFPLDATESNDLDGDGTGDNSDIDIDGDGVSNSNDAFPTDPNESLDLDNDGIANGVDNDIDGDGILNVDDAFPTYAAENADNDGDGIGNTTDTDDDNDGVLDDFDAFPFNASETLDSDGDGIGNNSDADDDNDGFTDDIDLFDLDNSEWFDTDGDGIGNNTDLDDDGDGTPDTEDAFILNSSESLDTDGDGIGNEADSDDDNDGFIDSNDPFPLNALEWLDTDGDGIGNNTDLDDDGDVTLDPLNPGEPDVTDAFPLDPSEWLDTDGDGIGNNSDEDDDGDSFLDVDDAFPLDRLEWYNTDANHPTNSDNIGDNADTDKDGDGIEDAFDLFPLRASEWQDSDFDGLGDNEDADDDNDNVSDVDDDFPFNPGEVIDTDGDGIGDASDADDDGDGFLDTPDAFPLDPTEWFDTDGDNIGNNRDLDDDNDTMLDEFELEFGFNPLDDRDGLLDSDGDGKTNAEEALALNANGDPEPTDPLIDDYGPVITPGKTLDIDATHIFTNLSLAEMVALTEVTVTDGKDGDGCCNLTAIEFETGSKNVLSGSYPILWRATDTAKNVTELEQMLSIHPLVNFTDAQTVGEGVTVRVGIVLSGEAPNYPLEIPFALSGSSDSLDFSISDTKFVLTSGTLGYIDIDIHQDFTNESDETIILTLDASVNAGEVPQHVITISENNLTPELSVRLLQQNTQVSVIAIDDGQVTINLSIDDFNISDTHIIDWDIPEYLLAEISANQLQVTFEPANIVFPDDQKNLAQLSVTVTDSGVGELSQTEVFSIPFVTTAPSLSTTDIDRDGINDTTEGYLDDDLDGLPAFLDNSKVPYLQPLHVNAAKEQLMETEPSLQLNLGKYARKQFADGVQLSEQELNNTGLISADSLTHTNEYFDFEIKNIRPFGRSVYVVMPLSSAIPEHAVYRKYTVGNQWQDYVINSKNAVYSSQSVEGICPPPASDLYVEGLTTGDVCLRLLIEDGGVNDADGIANGSIDDPGGIAIVSNETLTKEATPKTESSGSISFSWFMLLFILAGFRHSKNNRQARFFN